MSEAQPASVEVTGGRRSRPPFRADHVGSLLRPRRLLQAREDHAAGKLSAHALREIEDVEIREVVEMQRNAGLQCATDGEFRRASWHMDFIYQLGGIEKVQGEATVHFRNADGTVDFKPAAIAVNDKVGLDHTIFADDFRFLKEAAGDGVVPKLTIPSPNMVHYRSGRAALNPDVYPDIEPFWSDLSAAYARQIKAIAKLGCEYLQLDDTSLFGGLRSTASLRRRIEAASRFVPIEQLCLSPQCGFSSTLEGNQISYEQEVAKLELIVETAAEVWG